MGKREKGVREGSYGVGNEIRIRDKALSWSRVFEFLDEARTADRAGKISVCDDDDDGSERRKEIRDREWYKD